MRCLDIGPGRRPVPGFETLDLSPSATFVCDAARPIAPKNAYDVVHASHVLEHLEWWQDEAVIAAWAALLRPGGRLEVWVPDGHRLMKALVHLEETGEWIGPATEKWQRELHRDDRYLWAVGRLLSADSEKLPNNRHRAIITPKRLEHCMREAGLTGIRRLRDEERRGMDHGWINLGMVGIRP